VSAQDNVKSIGITYVLPLFFGSGMLENPRDRLKTIFSFRNLALFELITYALSL
jgi:hypothetical protein